MIVYHVIKNIPKGICNNCKYEFNYCITCNKPLCECGPYEQEGEEGDFYCVKCFYLIYYHGTDLLHIYLENTYNEKLSVEEIFDLMLKD